MAEVQEEELPLQQQPRPIQRRYRIIGLLGASMVQYSVAGEPSVQAHADAGSALTGFLLWLVMATRLPLFSAGLAAATAKFSMAMEGMKRLFFARQEPASVPA